MKIRSQLSVGFLALCLATLAVAQETPPDSSPSSSSSKARIKSQPKAPVSRLDPGAVSGNLYRDFFLGITCKIPEGWVLRTADMNTSEGDGADADASGNQKATDHAQGSRVLLAAFSRPPEARGEDVNGSILIAAESAASYPGLKDAAQYFGPVSEIAKAQGFEMEGEAYRFVVGAKTLARGDYQKDVGSLVMRQSTLVMLAHGYVVSFTFIGGTDDEVEELVQGLSFAAAKTTR